MGTGRIDEGQHVKHAQDHRDPAGDHQATDQGTRSTSPTWRRGPVPRRSVRRPERARARTSRQDCSQPPRRDWPLGPREITGATPFGDQNRCGGDGGPDSRPAGTPPSSRRRGASPPTWWPNPSPSPPRARPAPPGIAIGWEPRTRARRPRRTRPWWAARRLFSVAGETSRIPRSGLSSRKRFNTRVETFAATRSPTAASPRTRSSLTRATVATRATAPAMRQLTPR